MEALTNDDVAIADLLLNVGKYIHDKQANIFDSTQAYSAGTTGLLARLEAQETAVPGSVQPMLDAIPGWGGITYTEFKDLIYLIVGDINTLCVNNRYQLAAARKVGQ